ATEHERFASEGGQVMASATLGTVLRHIRTLAGTPATGEPADSELLGRFVRGHDEAAFAALMHRHGPMVLGVCRRGLGRGPDVEDAFQATFLVLVGKAGAIRKRASLGSWLHRVALRVVRKARARAACRRQHERQVLPMSRAEDSAAVLWRDLRPLLDEGLDQLPPAYRT